MHGFNPSARVVKEGRRVNALINVIVMSSLRKSMPEKSNFLRRYLAYFSDVCTLYNQFLCKTISGCFLNGKMFDGVP